MRLNFLIAFVISKIAFNAYNYRLLLPVIVLLRKPDIKLLNCISVEKTEF